MWPLMPRRMTPLLAQALLRPPALASAPLRCCQRLAAAGPSSHASSLSVALTSRRLGARLLTSSPRDAASTSGVPAAPTPVTPAAPGEGHVDRAGSAAVSASPPPIPTPPQLGLLHPSSDLLGRLRALFRAWFASLSPHARESLSALLLLLQFISFLHLVRSQLIDVMSCTGPSMLPTVEEGGDVLLVAKSPLVAHLFGLLGSRSAEEMRLTEPPSEASPYRRRLGIAQWFSPTDLSYAPGDVVVATSPSNPHQKVCKRVVALEGESVWALPAVPAMQQGWWATQQRPRRVRVPEGHVWIQGDNLSNSTDSRSYGAVPRALLQGRVVWRIYPFRGWGPLEPTLAFAQEARSKELEEDGEEYERGMSMLDALRARMEAQRVQALLEAELMFQQAQPQPQPQPSQQS